MRARIGRELGGHYRLTRLIGSGGMGAVYEARNTWTDRRVALKVLHPEHVKNREMVSRFLTEARAASAIRHPNIVDVLDMGLDAEDETFYIVQEFLEGEDLATRLEKEHTLRPRAVLDALVPVMGALVSAHRRGIIHRDVKPENVFLARGDDGGVTPKLIDFGIARMTAAEPDQRTTRAGMTIGTPQYMSPEQARGEDDLDARTDVWSLGVVFYECLSGVRPFEAANYNLVVVKILTSSPWPLRDVAPQVPASLAAVVDRALATARADRWPDVAAMLDALLQCRVPDETTPLATRHARSLRSPEEDAAVAIADAPLPSLSIPPRRFIGADETAPMPTNPPPALSPPPPPRAVSAWAWLAALAVLAALSAGVLVGRRSAPAANAERVVVRTVPAAPVIAPPPMQPVAVAPPPEALDAGAVQPAAVRAPVVRPARVAPSRPTPQLAVPRSGNNAPILPP